VFQPLLAVEGTPATPEACGLPRGWLVECDLIAAKGNRRGKTGRRLISEGGQTADGRWNPPTNFGHLVGDLLGMRNHADKPCGSHALNREMPSRHAGGHPERALEPLDESPWSRSGVALESPQPAAGGRRAHKSRSRVAWPRPISACSVGIVRA
jgi:hypothetical protein